jgi:hypothetical protein
MSDQDKLLIHKQARIIKIGRANHTPFVIDDA